MKTLKYSILRYSPSLIAGESINLGVLLSIDDGEHREFIHTKNWNRIEKFDDEVNVDGVKFLLNAIREEIAISIYNKDTFDIESFASRFTNEYRFDSPIEIVCEKDADKG